MKRSTTPMVELVPWRLEILPCPSQVDRLHLEVQIRLLLPRIRQPLVQQPLITILAVLRVSKLLTLTLMEMRILSHAVKLEMTSIGMRVMGLVAILKD